jgi:hypothetical protein
LALARQMCNPSVGWESLCQSAFHQLPVW